MTKEKVDEACKLAVHGEGVVINGYGTTKVDSSIKTARSIWFRREDGPEGRWTADFDMPVRAGHHLSFIKVKGPGLIKLPDAIRAGPTSCSCGQS